MDTTAGGTELLAANTKRRFLLVQNKGGADIYLRVDGGTVTSSNGLTLPAGDSVIYDVLAAVPVGQHAAFGWLWLCPYHSEEYPKASCWPSATLDL